MSTAINAISISDILWTRMTGHVLNFRYQGLPDDLHFSIAFNPGSPDVNLHVSRNIDHPDGKPRIEIARIAKTELNSLTAILHQTLLGMILRPISVRLFGRRSSRSRYGVSFLSFDRFGPDSDHPLQKMLINAIRPATKIRNKSFKLLPDAQDIMTTFAADPIYQQTVHDHLQWLSPGSRPGNTSGFLISRSYTGCVIRVNAQWYAIRQDADPHQALCNLMGPDLVAQFAEKIRIAVEKVSKAQSALDTGPFNDPIRLYKLDTWE